jgi:diguanylate cyclase (GGDEF)-like protein
MRMLASLLRWLRKPLTGTQPNNAERYAVMLLMPMVWGVLRLFFALYFLLNGQPALAWINLSGCCVYAACEALVRRERACAAAVAMSLEICAYSLVGVALLGWASGAQWLALAALLPHFLFTDVPVRWRIALVALVFLTLNACLAIGQLPAPALPARKLLLLQFVHANIVFFCLLLELALGRVQRLVSAIFSQRRLVEMQAESLLDPLTRLYNRRYLDEYFGDWIARTETGLAALVVMDLDDFKGINDAYGHAEGDRALLAFAQGLQTQFRRSDLCVRWGGDEFLLALPDMTESEAARLIKKLSEHLERNPYSAAPDGEPRVLRFSAGIGLYNPVEGFASALARCDQTMYENKRCAKARAAGGAAVSDINTAERMQTTDARQTRHRL